jgi:hypothetical protein
VVVTEKKPSSRPAPLPHRSTPQSVAKGGRGWSSSGRSSSRHRSERERDRDREVRDRDRERDEDRSGRDSGESFPQYWYVKTQESSFFHAARRDWHSFVEKPPGAPKSQNPRKDPPTVGCRFGMQADESHSMTCEKQFLPANNSYLYCSEP